MTKPKKIIYSNQEEVHQRIIKFVKSQLVPEVKEAYLVGSSTTGEFGKYETSYRNHDGSDIDLVAIVPEDSIPKDWKFLNTERDWWKLYRGGKIQINNILHKLDVLVVKQGMEDFARKRMKELNWKPEKLK
ncbi:nucleotidyltransferase domain-containing protein [archaeon]|jgi:predicted nucleotidyltransferase|nr:nucleotidyltransferase domain-containing protein [archaeon]MBT4373441.1 nucleotidyltransferase domain-containing protein [archaeon]MBT4531889.1 nucleotidyltransferase domain-containing protein [archaeon]MBT7001556.1 nucleotidyltransferase domain-containing protein [archaeon]MBT7282552.1 nucleotidyltransferase domain-containing protein [archaeon]